MGKYYVYAIATASWLVGEYEADSENAAIELAQNDQEGKHHASLCHQCASVDIADVYEYQAEPDTSVKGELK
ncbi:hypothetical protein N9878_00605 [bacterium]|nr:hypothetical protein [bacterium]